jgi:single-strand DNA-binding protein
MADLNRVFLVGNLTRDPETRYTPSNRAVCDMRLAVNRSYRTSDGQQRDETCYVDVVAWGRQAETCGQYLRKGSPVLVEGRLQYDEWEKEGQKFNRLRVIADRVQFLSAPRGAEFQDGPGSGPPPRRASSAAPREAADEQEGLGSEAVNDTADDDNLPF